MILPWGWWRNERENKSEGRHDSPVELVEKENKSNLESYFKKKLTEIYNVIFLILYKYFRSL